MKNSGNQRLDELLKDKLADKKAVVPDFVWDNIEAELFPKKKRRGLFWWFFTGSGIVAFATGIIFMIFTNTSTERSKHSGNIAVNGQEIQNSGNALRNGYHNLVLPKGKSAAVDYKTAGKAEREKLAKNKQNSLKKSGLNTSLRSQNYTKSTFPDLRNNLTRFSSQAGNSAVNETFTESAESSTEINSQTFVLAPTDSVPGKKLLTVDTLDKMKAQVDTGTYTLLPFNPLVLTAEEKRSLFSLSVYGGPSLYSIAVLKDYFTSGQLSNRTFSSSGFEAGFSFGINVTSRFGLYTGMAFNRKQSSFKYDLAVTQYEYFKLLDEGVKIPLANIADDGANACFIARDVSAKYSINTVLLSVGTTYELFRWKGFFMATDLRITANLKSAIGLNNVTVLTIPQPSDEKFSYYQPGIGIKLGYQLNKTVAIGFSPMYSRQFGRKEQSFYRKLDELIIPVTLKFSF